MTPEPIIQPLPYQHRTWFFRILLTTFVCLVPIFIFYAAGYRVTFDDADRSIVSVGGIFVSADAEDVDIFLNEDLVENYRLFQQAAYIQNLPAGMHRLHVQGEGLHTWVKQLPVYSHIVTEAQAFNFPLTPQVRLITPYQTQIGEAVVVAATNTLPLPVAAEYRLPFVAATSTATSTFVRNPEFSLVAQLFATSSATSTETLRSRIQAGIEEAFVFSSTVGTSTPTTTATTTRERADRLLYETPDGLAVRWIGASDNHPYYFCINTGAPVATSSALSVHMANNLAAIANSADSLTERGDFVCRDTIAINTWERPIYLFDFFPGYTDVLLVHLGDGLYAIEIDDRGWQNTQLLYPGDTFSVVLARDQILISDGGEYFELLTTLEN